MASRINTGRLILVRHGQSIYNLENRFTGWKDVPLTKLGEKEAHQAGKLLSNINFSFAFTSKLKRAQNTLNTILSYNKSNPEIIENIALNERDYGDLIGQNKSEAALKFGNKQVQIWRRSYDTPPPGGESLKMTCDRTVPYFKKHVLSKIPNNNIIISAHGNSIRAIIKYLFNYNKNDILKTEVGWCEPWIIVLHDNKVQKFNILNREGSKSMSFIPKDPILSTEVK